MPRVTDKRDKKLTAFIAYSVFASGVILIFLSSEGLVWKWDPALITFIRDLGVVLAAVMAVSILFDMFLREEMLQQFGEELDRRLHARVPTLDGIASQFEAKVPKLGQLTAETVHELFSKNFPGVIGLQAVVPERRNFSGYYAWTLETKPQQLFFAGRSVLNRVDDDLQNQQKRSAPDVILQRLAQGAMIWIDFLDPRSALIERLAAEEGGDDARAMLAEIARSVAIAKEIGLRLENESAGLPTNSGLQIRVFDHVPYFAYHRQDNDVLVGFYFLAARGDRSPAYELAGSDTKALFSYHFEQIHMTAKRLVHFDGSKPKTYSLNKKIFAELESFLSRELPKNSGRVE